MKCNDTIDETNHQSVRLCARGVLYTAQGHRKGQSLEIGIPAVPPSGKPTETHMPLLAFTL
jgi:hypothetical protein